MMLSEKEEVTLDVLFLSVFTTFEFKMEHFDSVML